jgi:hypothetical protein
LQNLICNQGVGSSSLPRSTKPFKHLTRISDMSLGY